MPPIRSLDPVDESGLVTNKAPWQVKYRKLKNLIFRDGFMRLRAGAVAVGPYDNAIDFLSVERGEPVFIGEIQHPGNTASGRENYQYTEQTLRPDGSSEPS